MNAKRVAQGFITYFILVFFVTGIVSFLYSLLVHGHGVADWESSLRLAIILGVVFPVAGELERTKKRA